MLFPNKSIGKEKPQGNSIKRHADTITQVNHKPPAKLYRHDQGERNRFIMAAENKAKNTGSNKNQNGKFSSKNIKHDPQAESARAKFGLQHTPSDGDRKTHSS